MPAPRRTAALVAAALALGGAGCGLDDPYGDPDDGASPTVAPATGGPSTTGSSAPQDLPPSADAELAALYDPALAPLGVEYTRGSVIVSESGAAHLALYVEPTGESGGPQGYLDRVVPLLAALDPLLFDEFEDLDSFDICQEPVAGEGADDPFPPPQTLLLVDREAFQSVEDWSTATLADLMVAVDSDREGQFDVLPEIELLPDWQAAEAAAGRS